MKVRIIFLALSLTMAACAKTPQAPMHVYNSAFLENDGVVDAAPKERGFDPLRTEDYPSNPTVYVVRNDGRWTGTSEPAPEAVKPDTAIAVSADPKPAPAPKRKKKPALAIGGTQGAVDSQKTEPTDVDTQGFEPAHAAEYVSAVYGMNSVSIPSDQPSSIYKQCKKDGRVYFGTKPKVGDIVFFHNTFDANGDGRNNDWYTHVGMVQSVGDDSTAEVVGWQNGAVTVHRINLERPEVAEKGGSVLNSRLREPGNSDAPFTQYYAGQLFAGFCGMLGEKAEFVLVENWQPGMNLNAE